MCNNNQDNKYQPSYNRRNTWYHEIYSQSHQVSVASEAVISCFPGLHDSTTFSPSGDVDRLAIPNSEKVIKMLALNQKKICLKAIHFFAFHVLLFLRRQVDENG